MKKILVLLTALALYQHWGRLQDWFDPAPANGRAEVVLYATQWCGYCAKTRALLAEEGIAYREVDIEQSRAGQAAFQALGGRGVPLLDVRGEIIHGYNPPAMRAAF
ncbi:glutaredoxin family protein [Pseudomonas sp. sp1636]|uniref:glutaredoxin family protein n=1 Tax=Pseudomonas sp. sp1636 TaxID=3036707 RepID=UPI0025A502DF|nr:glutaredoxin family protein [Pseudomonas sp. sp1636]MDM8347503.1 glutaredoxin family protein [Pseudomonas sp. sp1636]